MEQLVNFHTQNGVLEIQFNRADKKKCPNQCHVPSRTNRDGTGKKVTIIFE